MALGTAAALALGGASLGSAIIGSNSAKKAAGATRDASMADIALRREMYDDTTARFAPYYQGGTNAMEAMLFEMGLGDRPEGYEGYSMSPAARYRLEEGVDAIEGGAAARGGLYSGATMEALEDDRRRVVTSDMGDYFQRLGNLAGMGSAAAGNMGAAGQNFASGAGNAYQRQGAGAANAAMAQGQAWQTGIQDMAGIYGYMQNPMMNYATSMNTTYGYGPRGVPMSGTAPMMRP